MRRSCGRSSTRPPSAASNPGRPSSKNSSNTCWTPSPAPTSPCNFYRSPSGFHPGLYGSFMLMGFPEPNPDVVWVENLTNSVYFEGSDDVGRYTEVFDHLRATALGPPETRSRIKSMLKEL
ncbi:Scr1 family TA system antitoxin-like transcriptional regulator [Streptomyces mirabilis]|uniref:Scr1 family TA system antitoxin-like transcriptional regulator n=1 Tax=Streptomyces mirabilis TaxID=68239 RepID=UPI003715B669